MVCMANEEEKIAHQFLESFLNLVTVPSFSKCDMLARTGIYSIHALLLQIVPEVKTAGAGEILSVPEHRKPAGTSNVCRKQSEKVLAI